MTDNSSVLGLNIRREASGKSTRLGMLPRGSRVQIGERSKDGKWGRIAKVLEGKIAPAQQNGTVDAAAEKGWVFLGELDPGPKEPVKLDAIIVPEKPIAVTAGQVLGHVGEYQQFPDAQPIAKRGWRRLLHLEVFSGDDVKSFIAESRKYAAQLPAGSGNLFVIDVGAKLVQPSKPDRQIEPTRTLLPAKDSPSTGFWAKVQRGVLKLMPKSELGEFNSSDNTYSTGARWNMWYVGDKDDQRTQSAATAKKLNYKRREVWMPEGEAVWVKRTALSMCSVAPTDAWKDFPLKVANAKAPAAGFARVMSRSELENNRAEQRGVDDAGKHWCEVTVRGDSPGTVIKGWVCEKDHEHVAWQSPWAWPGFDWVEEGDIKPVDMFSSILMRTGAVSGNDLKDFKARADKVEKSGLVKKLYEQIDKNKNGNLDPSELRDAMKQPLLAQSLARLIAKYESEWGGNESKWTELDPLMKDGTAEWAAEKLRIKNLQWWPNVAGKVKDFPASPEVYHFHPIGLLNNFYSPAAVAGKASSDGGPIQKSGPKWHARFKQSSRVEDLTSPFRESFSKFKAALVAAGATPEINTTFRPPQRSYLMYYAREIATGTSPEKIPKFVPRNGDEPVNIDWVHLDANNKPDLVAAKQAAVEMDKLYAAAGAIGKAYESNHNGGEAVDMRVSGWAIGKTIKDANGKEVLIGSKQDLIDVGATYGVYHWNYSGPRNKKDDPHWSLTGN